MSEQYETAIETGSEVLPVLNPYKQGWDDYHTETPFQDLELMAMRYGCSYYEEWRSGWDAAYMAEVEP